MLNTYASQLQRQRPEGYSGKVRSWLWRALSSGATHPVAPDEKSSVQGNGQGVSSQRVAGPQEALGMDVEVRRAGISCVADAPDHVTGRHDRADPDSHRAGCKVSQQDLERPAANEYVVARHVRPVGDTDRGILNPIHRHQNSPRARGKNFCAVNSMILWSARGKAGPSPAPRIQLDEINPVALSAISSVSVALRIGGQPVSLTVGLEPPLTTRNVPPLRGNAKGTGPAGTRRPSSASPAIWPE